MKALLLDAVNKTATFSDITIPEPGPNELLIAVKAIALNPVDGIFTFNPLGSTGRVIGSDFAGLVVARGPPISSSSSSSPINTNHPTTSSPTTTTAANNNSHSIGINRGDRVAGFLQGACSVNDRPGAFAEYVICPADLVWRVPPHLSFEEAASISLCGLTAAQGLFFRMGLDAPFRWEDDSDEGVLRRVESEKDKGDDQLEGRRVGGGEEEGEKEPWSFFVFGASTSVGMYVAQLVHRSAEVSGRPVRLIGAANPRNWDMLKAAPYGYDHLVDYRDPSWPDQVRQASSSSSSSSSSGGRGVHFAYDAISDALTVRDVSRTLVTGGKMAVVRSKDAGAWETEGVTTEPLYGAAWEGLGEDIQYPQFMVRTSPAKRAFASAFYKWLSDGGQLHPNPIRVMPGGLDKVVVDGLTLLGTGVLNRGHDRTEEHMRPISGEKIVYRIETERNGSTGEGHFG